MAKKTKAVSTSRLRKNNQITLKDKKTGEIKSSIFTKDTQFGIPGESIRKQPTVRSYGNIKAYAGLSGSLQTLTSGVSYLVAGSGVTIQTGSNGQITITAGSISPADALTFGNGFTPYNAAYNGTAPISMAVLAESNKGLTSTSSGIKIDFGNLIVNNSPTTSFDLITRSGTDVYSTPISSVLSLGISSNVTLNNPITFGNGVEDANGNSSYDNTSAVNLRAKAASNKGISVSSNGLEISPSNLTSAVVASSDTVIIGDANDSDNAKYVTAHSMADLASVGNLANSLTLGNGLSPSAVFNGSSPITVSVSNADATLSVGSSGVSVLKVPNSLVQGNGISSFTFDGSSAQSVSINTPSNSGLRADNTGLYLKLSNLPDATFNGNDYLSFYDVSSGVNGISKGTINSFRTQIIDPAVQDLLISDNSWTGKNIFSNISGSITHLPDGNSYLNAGSNITITSASNGQITIAAAASAPVTSSISNVTQASPGIVTTTTPHNLSENQSATITDVTGMTELNGNKYYADVLTNDTFALYSDSSLSTAVNTSAFTAYVSGGKVTGGGGSANSTSPFITWQIDSELDNERILSSSSGLDITNDGSNLVIRSTPRKVFYKVTGSLHASSVALDIPGARFNDNSYDLDKTDVYLNGVLLLSGSGLDYSLAGNQNSILFEFDLTEDDRVTVKFS